MKANTIIAIILICSLGVYLCAKEFIEAKQKIMKNKFGRLNKKYYICAVD